MFYTSVKVQLQTCAKSVNPITCASVNPITCASVNPITCTSVNLITCTSVNPITCASVQVQVQVKIYDCSNAHRGNTVFQIYSGVFWQRRPSQESMNPGISLYI